MKCNVGTTESYIRMGAGAVAILGGLVLPVGRGLRLGLIAVGTAEVITGAMRYCPLSEALGINTCENESDAASRAGEEGSAACVTEFCESVPTGAPAFSI